MASKKNSKNIGSSKSRGSKKSEVRKGSQYVCADCGFVVVVDEVCGCEACHEIVCCGEPMAVRECL